MSSLSKVFHASGIRNKPIVRLNFAGKCWRKLTFTGKSNFSVISLLAHRLYIVGLSYSLDNSRSTFSPPPMLSNHSWQIATFNGTFRIRLLSLLLWKPRHDRILGDSREQLAKLPEAPNPNQRCVESQLPTSKIMSMRPSHRQFEQGKNRYPRLIF